jgi:hypothetical protein
MTDRTVLAVQAVDAVDAADLARQARRLSMWARVVLVPVAVIGAVLSYQSLYKAAQPTFGPYLAGGFPLLVDLLILGASLQYVAGAKIGRPMTGWRLTAHCGVAATLVLNALAARELGEVPWHVTAPAVWAVLVELTGKQVLGQWRASHQGPAASIAASLWVSSPVESFRTRLLMARTGVADAHEARISVGTAAAAREALNLSLPRRSSPRRDARRVRRVVNRQLRAGSLPPQAVMEAVGWSSTDRQPERSPESILRAVVQTILRPGPSGPWLPEEVRKDRVVVLPEADPLPSRPPLVQAGRPARSDEEELATNPATNPATNTADDLATELVTALAADPVVTYATSEAAAAAASAADVTVDSLSAPSALSTLAAESSAASPTSALEGATALVTGRSAFVAGGRSPSVLEQDQVPTAPLPSGSRGPEVMSLWAAAQVRTNGPASPPIPSGSASTGPAASGASGPAPSQPADPQDRASILPGNGPVAEEASRPPSPEAVYGTWSPVPPYKPIGPVSPASDSTAFGRSAPDEEDASLDTGSLPTLSRRPTVKQKEERLAIAVRIVHRRPEITGAELRAELEKEGWLVSDRTAARILGEARVTPPLRAVQG